MSSRRSKQQLRSGERAALALVASGVCYNPKCSEPLIVQRDGRNVINYEVAHIRDELSPADFDSDVGWRYWPADDLTQEDRNRFKNLILLCAPCHKLIDKIDPRRYSAETLHEWKLAGECGRGAQLTEVLSVITAQELEAMLLELLPEAPSLVLTIPEPLLDASLLSFAQRAIPHIGMADDTGMLQEFLEADTEFSWLILNGEAGAGKSRLALELCLAIRGTWYAGFLPESSQEALGSYSGRQPTLVVVDYAASRAEMLGKALLEHANHNHEAPLRVLIVERGLDRDWVQHVLREHRHTESRLILAHQYSLPISVSSLSEDDLGTIILETAAVLDREIEETELPNVVQHAQSIDPLSRPLFAMIAAIDWLEGPGIGSTRDSVLRSILRRRSARQLHAYSAESMEQARWLEMLATTVGGVNSQDYLRACETARTVARISYPVPGTINSRRLDALIDGVRPDILGEIYVLDLLEKGGMTGQLARASLDVGWRFDRESYAAFVERTARDHPYHRELPQLLRAESLPDIDLEFWLQLVCNVVPLLQSSSNPHIQVLRQLMENRLVLEESERVRQALAQLQFYYGNHLLAEGAFDEANLTYSAVLTTSRASWAVHFGCLTNRGIIWKKLGDQAKAETDWETVIDARESSDEAKACCLNNRADIRDAESRMEEAIKDRTGVLELTETSYNRRFIALIRRSRALWASGQTSRAFNDIASILATSDIVMEQKMSALLTRARWFVGLGNEEDATKDLSRVLESRRNFKEVLDEARCLYADVRGSRDE